jgi:hypothetical protein
VEVAKVNDTNYDVIMLGEGETSVDCPDYPNYGDDVLQFSLTFVGKKT